MTILVDDITTTPTPDTIAHVSRAVAHHSFVTPEDYAAGLAELATLSDDDIEAIAEDDGHEYPPAPLDKLSPRFLKSQRRRFGITTRKRQVILGDVRGTRGTSR